MKKSQRMRSEISAMAVLALAMSLYAANAHRVNADPQADLAATPPMGWNSFDSYGVYLHEKAALANVEAMAKKLRPYGYEYFVVDNGWFGEYELQSGTMYSAEKHAHDVNVNKYGYFLPSKVYFPHGLRPIADRCHELGLKFGVHLMRGIPRKAYELNLPIQGTEYTARDVAVTDPEVNCKWCQYCYGVDMTHPGGQAWYDGLIQHIAGLGVDFIKYDDIVPYPAEVEAVAQAIRKCGSPIVLSLSPGGSVDPDAIDSFRMANMLRVTHDIWDDQKGIDACFDAWRKWQGKEQPGFWIDMDMIPFGQLQLMSPPSKDESKTVMDKGDIALAGKGVNRWCQLSEAQKRTFITLRALAASPLMMGGDLPSLDDESLALLTNEQMLACNQNGVMGECLSECDGVEVWRVRREGHTDAGWAGVFNRTEKIQHPMVTLKMLGVDTGAKLQVLDVWNERNFTLSGSQSQPLEIEPHDVLFLAFKPGCFASPKGLQMGLNAAGQDRPVVQPQDSGVEQASLGLMEAEVKGGLVVHVGCGDGSLCAALGKNPNCVVQGLHRDPIAVARARSPGCRFGGPLGRRSVGVLCKNRREDCRDPPHGRSSRVRRPNRGRGASVSLNYRWHDPLLCGK